MNNNATLQKPTWCAPLQAQTLSDLLIPHLWLLWKAKCRKEDTSWWFPTCKEWTVVLRPPSWGQRPDGSHDALEVREMLWTHEREQGAFDYTKVRLHKNAPAVLHLKRAKPQPWQAPRGGSSKGWFFQFLDGLSSRWVGSSEQCWPQQWAWQQHCHPAVTASGQPFSIFSDEKEQSAHYNPLPKNVRLTLGSLCLGSMSSSWQVSSLRLRNLSTRKQTTVIFSVYFAFDRVAAQFSRLHQLCSRAKGSVRLAFSFFPSYPSFFISSPEAPEQM